MNVCHSVAHPGCVYVLRAAVRTVGKCCCESATPQTRCKETCVNDATGAHNVPASSPIRHASVRTHPAMADAPAVHPRDMPARSAAVLCGLHSHLPRHQHKLQCTTCPVPVLLPDAVRARAKSACVAAPCTERAWSECALFALLPVAVSARAKCGTAEPGSAAGAIHLYEKRGKEIFSLDALEHGIEFLKTGLHTKHSARGIKKVLGDMLGDK